MLTRIGDKIYPTDKIKKIELKEYIHLPGCFHIIVELCYGGWFTTSDVIASGKKAEMNNILNNIQIIK
jgi:hypothetical protein